MAAFLRAAMMIVEKTKGDAHNPMEKHTYTIEIKGQISSALMDPRDGVTIENREGRNTLLHLISVDQAALFGVLLRIRDLGIDLISVSTQK
jgi:hypothetical protein